MSNLQRERLKESIENMVKRSWNAKGDMTGKVITIEKLLEIFPEDPDFGKVRMFTEKGKLGSSMQMYYHPYIFFRMKIAYDCESCGIVVGPPKVNLYDFNDESGSSSAVLTDCGSCGETLLEEGALYR